MSGTVQVSPRGPAPAAAVPPVAPCPITPPANPYVTVEQFRVSFALFSDATVYPDATVQSTLDIAGVMIDPMRWRELTSFAMGLITAHFLTLQRYATQKAGGASGAGVPGLAPGLVGSKSVSKVSVSYDNSIGEVEGAGPWNYTMWGRQYAHYAMMAGTGGYETLAISPTWGSYGIVHTWAYSTMLGLAWS